MQDGARSAGTVYLADATRRLREAKAQADRALAQVPFERWPVRLDPESNSLVTLVLHVSGNQLSRWTDFLTTDGEKPDRHRDAEFEDASLSREAHYSLHVGQMLFLAKHLAGESWRSQSMPRRGSQA